MNKLMGFYELKNSSLPTVKWQEYHEDSILDENLLWTVRTAVIKGDDLNLPRLVGENSFIAREFANKISRDINNKGIVIYYPYFIAQKSGTLNVFSDHTVIEAVNNDLWNLVTYSEREVTIIIDSGKASYDGNEEFLSMDELAEITSYIKDIRYRFKDFIFEGKSVLLEWSFAYNCDINKNKIGDKYLVFYEARIV